MTPDVTFAVSVAATLAVVCIGALRLVDLNEREPLWALALLLWLGIVAAGFAALVADPQEQPLPAAALAEGAKALAIAAGLAAIAVIGRRRRASELNSLLDWMLYGAAAGAGFAIGDGFLRETFTAGVELQSPDPRDPRELLWMTAQSCLTEAAFGALFGLSLGLAAGMRGRAAPVAVVMAGFGCAVLAHSVYAEQVLQDGVHAPGVSVFGAVTVALIVALAVALLLNALGDERRAIDERLWYGERRQIVSRQELELLRRPLQRHREYLSKLAKGDFGDWLEQRRIHDHQVALAFAKRSGAERDAETRRAAIRRLREHGLAAELPSRAAIAVTAVVALAGAAVIWQASGGQTPSTFATRTSLVQRDLSGLAAADRPRRTLREQLLEVPARWRLLAAREHRELRAAGAREAYELQYRSPDGFTLRYALATFPTVEDARRVAARLAAPSDADAWPHERAVAQVRGLERARTDFCEALPRPASCQP
jgi:RsiW-degrading membrane proteinase PrsW (M82 family)